MNWRDYENITKLIYETLGRQAGVKIEGHGSTCKVKGNSGVDHQIDVLTSLCDGVHTYRTAIECKCCEEAINKDIVMKLSAIIEDAGINKGVIVSKKGFTEDGISFAKYKNIGLVELRETEVKDQNGCERSLDIGVMNLNINATLRRPEIVDISIDSIDSNLTPEQINPYRLKVKLNDGQEVPFDNYLMSFKNELHKVEPDKVVQKSYELNGASLVDTVTKNISKIRGFTLTGKLTVKDVREKRQIHLVDEVWLIMKSLFEGRAFTISKTGFIKEDKKQYP